ncbi:MAG TPA: SagB family peptide dehydrogenase [Actinophytocola sp.]|uniref:SagB family peptide dehydrogenase n=1 Tax=Actinophytocola sp. TaxID=1872138 RepID=UPI002DB59E2E|nr:SagB family peptide dehydrogenase [Actinophytocola sp.]HEU5475369.1 SagB family peptide dehydrogenase [Actinophytocola sp.]
MITTRSATLSKAPGEGSAARIRLWSLREDVLVETPTEEDRLVVVTRWGETRIDEPGELVRESLRRMSFGPISLQNLVPPGRSPDADPRTRRAARDWARLWRVLEALSGSVVHSLGLPDGEGPVLSAVPIVRQAAFRLPEVDPDRPVRLSRFAAMRARDGELVLESPLAQYEVVLHRTVASAVAAALSAPIAVTELADAVRADRPVVAEVVAYLAATGIVAFGDWDPQTRTVHFAEDDDPDLIPWSHHDLLFHSRSRMGRHGGPTGAVFPYAGRLPSPPLVKAVPPGRRFPLYRPTTPELVTQDPTLTEVIEGFRLCEDLSDRELSAEQIGELLFRAARIRSVAPASAGAEVTYRISDRPYLSIHGLHELELYLSLHRCAGLPRAIYHYDPQQHALTLINDSQPELDDLLDLASIATGTIRRPPALITLTARVARSAWMYRGIAYSLALTHVGALQQMLCLAATAMGLAACVPAIDPGDVTDTALRLDWPAEIGVGDCIVGYRRLAPHSP